MRSDGEVARYHDRNTPASSSLAEAGVATPSIGSFGDLTSPRLRLPLTTSIDSWGTSSGDSTLRSPTP